MKTLNGYGFSITLKKCEVDITDNKNELKKFLDDVVENVEMYKLGDAVFRTGSMHLPGISAIQVIETSHIAIHCFSKDISYMFNIESCKRFNVTKLKCFLVDYFNPKDFKINAQYEVEV